MFDDHSDYADWIGARDSTVSMILEPINQIMSHLCLCLENLGASSNSKHLWPPNFKMFLYTSKFIQLFPGKNCSKWHLQKTDQLYLVPSSSGPLEGQDGYGTGFFSWIGRKPVQTPDTQKWEQVSNDKGPCHLVDIASFGTGFCRNFPMRFLCVASVLRRFVERTT